jgi:acyl dehydratase
MIEWFDDVRIGMRFKTAEKLVTREDIKRFAAEFDPQPYHLDEARSATFTWPCRVVSVFPPNLSAATQVPLWRC